MHERAKDAVMRVPDVEARCRLLAQVRASAAAKATAGPDAARSQDFLYDENGLPA